MEPILSTFYKREIAAKITGSFVGIPTDYVVGVVRAVRRREPTSDDPDDSVEAVIAHVIACVSCGVPDPLYIMTGGTYVSRDGEYRHRLLWYSTFMEAKFPDVLDGYVADLINNDELGFHISLFGGASLDDERRGLILERLEEDMFARRAFEACWMVDTIEFISTGLVPNHHNLAYAKLMYHESLPEDKVLLDEIMKTMSKQKINEFNKHKLIQDSHGRLEVGCKYIPLTIGDLRDMVDPRVPIWREYRLTQKLADLAVSGVGTGFPIIRGYFYVQNVHEGFFDNPELQQDFIIQDHLQASIEKIKTAQKHLRESRERDPADRLRAVEEDLDQPLMRADRYLRLSNLALATVMEHAGRTARDMPKITHQLILEQRAGKFLPYINTAMFSTDAFLKIFFDWMWGFLCMHSEGIMHADPHLNNLTFQRVSKTFQYDVDKPTADTYQYYQVLELREFEVAGETISRIVATTPPIDYPFSRYTLRKKSEQSNGGDSREYILPFYDIAGSIIDMSRALLRDLPADNVEIAEDMLAGQIEWVLHLLELFGEREDYTEMIKPHRARLVYLMQTEWPDMWRLLTALDAWTLSFYWGGLLTQSFLKQQGLGDLEVDARIRETILRVHRTTVDWLKRVLGKLLPSTLRVRDVLENDPATSGPPFERVWADKVKSISNSNSKKGAAEPLEQSSESEQLEQPTEAQDSELDLTERSEVKRGGIQRSERSSLRERSGWRFPLQWIIERAFEPYESRQFDPELKKLRNTEPRGKRPRGLERWEASPLRDHMARDPNAMVIDQQDFEAPRYSATDPARYAPETKTMLRLLLDSYSEEDRRRNQILREACRRDEPRERGFVDRAVRRAEEGGDKKKGGAESNLLAWPEEGF